MRVVHPKQFALVLTAVRHAHERRLQGQSMLRIDRGAIEARGSAPQGDGFKQSAFGLRLQPELDQAADGF